MWKDNKDGCCVTTANGRRNIVTVTVSIFVRSAMKRSGSLPESSNLLNKFDFVHIQQKRLYLIMTQRFPFMMSVSNMKKVGVFE